MEEHRERLISDEDIAAYDENCNAEQEGTHLVKDLMFFDKSYKELPLIYLLKTFLGIGKEVGKLMPLVLGGILINTFGYLFLNMAGDTMQLAAVGLNTFMVLIFFTALVLSSLDKLGMELSKAYGAKDYKRMRETFSMGMITFFSTYMLITVPIFFYAESSLIKMGINPVIAAQMKGPARLNIALFCLQILTEGMQIMCISQGLEVFF
jgi:Na+-driven multidrug efflux pump